MKRLILIGLAGAIVAGCSAGGDVSSNDVKSKEDQIAKATQKLNGNQPQQDESQQ